MLKIFNDYYYLDVDFLDDYAKIKSDIPTTGSTEEMHINVAKYEMIKIMIEVLMERIDDVDEALGTKNQDLPISFKIAFNTLLNKKILNKVKTS